MLFDIQLTLTKSKKLKKKSIEKLQKLTSIQLAWSFEAKSISEGLNIQKNLSFPWRKKHTQIIPYAYYTKHTRGVITYLPARNSPPTISFSNRILRTHTYPCRYCVVEPPLKPNYIFVFVFLPKEIIITFGIIKGGRECTCTIVASKSWG